VTDSEFAILNSRGGWDLTVSYLAIQGVFRRSCDCCPSVKHRLDIKLRYDQPASGHSLALNALRSAVDLMTVVRGSKRAAEQGSE